MTKIDHKDMKRMVEGFIAERNFVPTTSLCKAYLELHGALEEIRELTESIYTDDKIVGLIQTIVQQALNINHQEEK